MGGYGQINTVLLYFGRLLAPTFSIVSHLVKRGIQSVADGHRVGGGPPGAGTKKK